MDYGTQRVAVGTIGYKYRTLPLSVEKDKLANTSNYLLKVISHVEGTARVCALVRLPARCRGAIGVWTGPAGLALEPHALAPVADLPVEHIIGARHVIANLTLDIGEAAFDYLAPRGCVKLAVSQ